MPDETTTPTSEESYCHFPDWMVVTAELTRRVERELLEGVWHAPTPPAPPTMQEITALYEEVRLAEERARREWEERRTVRFRDWMRANVRGDDREDLNQRFALVDAAPDRTRSETEGWTGLELMAYWTDVNDAIRELDEPLTTNELTSADGGSILTDMTTTATPNYTPSLTSRSRVARALAMRQNGATYTEIAATEGYRSAAVAEANIRRFVDYINNRGAARPTRRTTARATVTARSLTRRFGVEIEFKSITMSAAARALEPVLGYLPSVNGYHGSTDYTRWQVQHDGSVTRNGRGGEVVSPVLSGPEGFAQLKAVMAALRAAGATISSACGMHVHVDATNLLGDQIARLIQAYVDRQTTFDHFVSPSRRSTRYHRYCSPVAEHEKVQWMESFKNTGRPGSAVSRYRTVNVASFGRTGTIEFRQHQGSLNGTKAVAWIEMLLALVECVIAVEDETLTADPIAMVAALVPYGMTNTSARNLTNRAAAVIGAA